MKEMNLDEIMSHIKRIALPYVKTALGQENEIFRNDKKQQKLMKQVFFYFWMAERGLDPVKRLHRFLAKIIKVINGKEKTAEEALLSSINGAETINYMTTETADVISTTWVEFLGLALESKENISLNDYLLPQKKEDASEELWKMFEECFYPLVISPEQGRQILRQFAKEVLLPEKTVEFSNLNLVIEALQDKPRTFLVRQK